MTQNPSSANAERGFHHTRVIAAPRARVLRAFSEPERLARWWGPAGFSSTFAQCDFRPGGAWRFVLHGPDGSDYPNENIFQEIGPERVVIEHLATTGHHFILTVGLADEGGSATRVEWAQVFDSAEERARVAPFVPQANEQNLDRLAAEVARIAP